MIINYFNILRSERFYDDRECYSEISDFINSFGGTICRYAENRTRSMIDISEEDFLILKLKYGYKDDISG